MNVFANHKKVAISMILMAGVFATTGCKTGSSSSTASEFVDHIKLEKGAMSFNYVTTLSSNVEVNMEGQFPIGEYGSVVFYNDAQNKLNVGVSAKFDLWDDFNFQTVSGLPNGAPFPVIVKGKMDSLQIDKNMWVYVQKDATANTQALVGLALQLDGISNNFPQMEISQSFWNGDVRYATFTIYGPRKVNGQQVPGGIFLVGDTSQVIDAATGVGASNAKANRVTMKFSGPEAKNYKSVWSQKKLMAQVKKALAQHGIYLKD